VVVCVGREPPLLQGVEPMAGTLWRKRMTRGPVNVVVVVVTVCIVTTSRACFPSGFSQHWLGLGVKPPGPARRVALGRTKCSASHMH